MSQLNLPHGNRQVKSVKQKNEKAKMDMLRSNNKNLGNHVVSPEEEKERLQWEGFAEKEGFKSGQLPPPGRSKRGGTKQPRQNI